MNLAEICDNAKKGREYALLGNYDSSMVYYQGVIQQIQRHCQSVRDPAVKGKWQQVRPRDSFHGRGPASVVLARLELEMPLVVRTCQNTEMHFKMNSE